METEKKSQQVNWLYAPSFHLLVDMLLMIPLSLKSQPHYAAPFYSPHFYGGHLLHFHLLPTNWMVCAQTCPVCLPD